MLFEVDIAAHVGMVCGLRHGCGVHCVTRLLYGLEDVLKPLAGEEPVLETYLACLLEDILRIELKYCGIQFLQREELAGPQACLYPMVGYHILIRRNHWMNRLQF